MACQGSSYTRTAKRSLGVYDLIAAGEGRELTSRYSALEQSDRTHGPSTQASQHYTNPNKQGRLPRRMPYHVVMELALTGDTLPAERFHEFGVVNHLAEPGSAVEVALELADRLAKNAPLALAASKQILQEQWDWSSAEMWEKQIAISGPVFASEDAKEGASAFKEKRDPVWRGR